MPLAEVVKLADTQRSGRCARKSLWVQIPPSALINIKANEMFKFYPALACIVWGLSGALIQNKK